MRQILACLAVWSGGWIFAGCLAAQTSAEYEKLRAPDPSVEVTSENCAKFPGGCEAYYAVWQFDCLSIDALHRTEPGRFYPRVYYSPDSKNLPGKRWWLHKSRPSRGTENRFEGRTHVDIPPGWSCTNFWQSDRELRAEMFRKTDIDLWAQNSDAGFKEILREVFMEFAGMNYLAVVAAALASFFFGFAWYSILAKAWVVATGRPEEELKAGGMAKPMIITIICQLFVAFFLAGILGHLGAKMVTVEGGLITGFFVWLGFSMTTIAMNYAWQRAKIGLYLIDGGHWLGVLLLQGAVLGAMGV
ncbi:MAG: DUF1761 family protein [Alphaproteobacteria bacterium]|nr:DUF1761 family protein [Alphaproteobacteria bacterium]